MTAEWAELKSKLDGYQAVYDEPIPSLKTVNTIPDAPLCGGGKVTVAVDGTHREVNYHLTKADFWHVMLHPGRMFDGYSILPSRLCRLALTVYNADGTAGHGRHVQDMAGAEIRSELPLEGGLLEVRCTALAQRGLVVYELKAREATATLKAEIAAESEHQNFFICKGTHDDTTVWLRKEHHQLFAVNAAVAMCALGANDVRTHEPEGAAALSFEVPAGQTVRLLLSVAGGKEEFRHLEEALAALESTEFADVDGMLDAHADWWQDFWLRSWVDLGDTILERYYYGAQYVHGCSIDLDGRVVPGLAGGWITHPTPIWGGNYTMNYNGEAPFWGLVSSNRGEWTVPYARVCFDYIPSGRKLAKRLGTKGIVMPVMIGPWGVPNHDDALFQKSNASLAALTLIWHVEASLDVAFLEEIAFPFLRELMDFWEDNLTLDDAGRYVIENSAQRERTPGDLNPGSELAAVRRITGAALAFSEVLGVDADRRELWRDFLHRLSDYPAMEVNGGLCYVETENRMEVSLTGVGDNPVVLDHVYPHGALDADPNDKGRIIARNTLRYLNSWNQDNAFPRIFSQAVRAEWPGGDLLERFTARVTSEPGPHECLRRNNTFLPRDHSYEGSGSTEFINSMLAQAHGGVLKVFHVWPKERDASFVRIRVRGGFLVSGELKDGEVSRLEVYSEQGGSCRMLSCWSDHGISVTSAGDSSAKIEVSSEGDIYTWETAPRTTYHVTSGAPVSQDVSNPPLMLVPLIELSARAHRDQSQGMLDILLTPEVQRTQLAFEAVHADERHAPCTADCRFTIQDETVVCINDSGEICATGPGRTAIAVDAEVDGYPLMTQLSVEVLDEHLLPLVNVTCSGEPVVRRETFANHVECIRRGDGTDGPGIGALHRICPYPFFVFAALPEEARYPLAFDFGEVQPVGDMWVWNYNAPDDFRVLGFYGGTAVGLRDVTIEYSADGNHWEELQAEGYPFRLARATGKQWMPATNLDDGRNSPIRFHGARARYVRITPHPTPGIGNWGAARFGLSQVRFTRA